MIKTRLASTTITDEELKENWSRRPGCSMIHNLFLGLTSGGASQVVLASSCR